MSNISDADKLASANIAFSEAVDALPADLPGTYQLLSRSDGAPEAKTHEIGWNEDVGPDRERKDGEAIALDGQRAYAAQYALKTRQRGTRSFRKDVMYDHSGRVGRSNARWVRESGIQLLDKLIWAEINANPSGPDGVALISASHPFAPGGGTQSNSATGVALSFDAYNNARIAMSKLQKENGDYITAGPTHLFVPPDLERKAKEITGADRPFGMNASGVEAGASVVASSMFANVFQGELIVVVTPRLAAADWLLADLSGSDRPFMHQASSLRKLMPDEREVHKMDEFGWHIELDYLSGPEHWQLAYGRLDG